MRAWVDGLAPSVTAGGRYVILSEEPGDVDRDGSIDGADVVLALKMAAGQPVEIDAKIFLPPYAGIARYADLDGDGEITVADALLIMRAWLGLPVGD